MKQSVTPWVMRTCPVCKEEFLPAGQHSWMIGDIPSKQELVCTYPCMRKWETDPSRKKKKRCTNGKKIKVRVIETGEVFDSMQECAEALGASATTVHRCLYKHRSYNGLHIEKVRM